MNLIKPKRKKNRLLDASGKFVDSFDTYAPAVKEGNMLLGWGRFMVETPGRVPSRAEQLLQTTKVSKQKAVLESL